MKRVITGNQAVAYGVILSRVDVISAYPITPQTTIVEELSELIASGRLKTKFLKVEYRNILPWPPSSELPPEE